MWARDFLLPTTSPNWRDWVEFNKTVTWNEGVHPSVDPVWLRSNVTPCFKKFQMVANFTVSGLGCVMFHVVDLIALPNQYTCPPKTVGISVQFGGSFCISSLQNVSLCPQPRKKRPGKYLDYTTTPFFQILSNAPFKSHLLSTLLTVTWMTRSEYNTRRAAYAFICKRVYRGYNTWSSVYSWIFLNIREYSPICVVFFTQKRGKCIATIDEITS
jgi:hypothetical protein